MTRLTDIDDQGAQPQLHKELRETREERAILKRAVAFCVGKIR